MNSDRLIFLLAYVLAGLVLVATGTGLLLPALYAHIAPQLVAGALAQDLVVLLSLPLFGLCLRGALKGTPRQWVMVVGLLILYAYGYALYAIGPMYDPIYPIYLPILSLSVLLIVLIVQRLDATTFHVLAVPRLPARSIAILFLATVLLLAPVWSMQLAEAMALGVPSVFSSVHVMDLAIAFPALLVASVGLLRKRAWGTALAGPLLVKGTLVTFSLVLAEALAWYLNKPMDPWPVVGVFVAFTCAGALMLWRSMATMP